MSCNACTRKYGFFCKESGCPSCGYSYCVKCLKKEIEVPRCNNAKLKVCLRCFEKLEKEKEKLSSKIENIEPISNTAKLFEIDVPPDVLAPPIEPIHLAEEVLPSVEDEAIENNLDSVISKKLKNLKADDDTKKLPSVTDMSARLAELKGVPFKEYSKADILLCKDTRTDKQKIDDLVKQFVEETTIDEEVECNINPLADIERRLAALKGENFGKKETTTTNNNMTGGNTPSYNDENEEEAVKRTLKKYLEEAKLPDVPTTEEEELIAGLPKPTAETEELPWCTICNEDAAIRCLGCDGDLFCRNCFRECHDDEDFREHKSEIYSKSPTFKENHF